ncbi:HAMP domain-containing histidine kinase [Geobacter sp. FeAm09]|uniref:sensor histidine kinase n=1 Tax=Geobacter sp. FeAm09 TaxID=2597769 RepID=UPI0011EFC771|nr:HAMP domain-containing sensor histidine kinase [Geobacter sp. FeAm09]QEM66893.1 HAMP domain-containing histidine kinase [Geobacter sp. FeAm09]
METPADRHIDGAISQELLKQLAYNEKMSELGRISAGVVHELNAPLSVIISASQLIMREADVPEFVREMVARISSEAMRLSHMTRGLLNFSSQEEAESGGEADVNLTVEFVLDFLDYEAARRGVTLLRKLDYHLPVVEVGANLLKQVLLNIIMNALQAMEELEGGSLMVETVEPEPGKVSIVITDTGPGIPAAALTRIFDPYFTTKKPGEGTGLGLFVTRTLVENLGGSIGVRSTEGEGTTFTVTFAAEES